MKTKRITFLAMLIAISMILSYLESFLPQIYIVPGIKLGLANIPVMFAIFKLKPSDALIISGIRILLLSMLFRNFLSFLFSITGGLMSIGLMLLCKKMKFFSILGISVVGGVSHNLGQILIAVFIANTPGLFFYLPILIVSGTLAGIAIGLICNLLVNRIQLPSSD
ncbi:MAG TPA: Gx transporter family protein [Clostridiaceae bacterium]|nr:Gx transporter family protein [Clostridiaceae bacterium]